MPHRLFASDADDATSALFRGARPGLVQANSSEHRLKLRRVYLIVLSAVTLGLLIWADVPLERRLSQVRMRGDLRDVLNVCESFGCGVGVAVVLIAVATLDPRRRTAVPRMAAAAYGGGLLANLMKLCVSRARPHTLDLAACDVWSTFGDLMPLTSAGSEGQSFPSAHTATAAGLAVALAGYYPRGRWLFFVLTVGVACQRTFSAAHFPLDVIVGAAVGWIWAHRLAAGNLGSAWFDRWEGVRRRRNSKEVGGGEAPRSTLPLAEPLSHAQPPSTPRAPRRQRRAA